MEFTLPFRQRDATLFHAFLVIRPADNHINLAPSHLLSLRSELCEHRVLCVKIHLQLCLIQSVRHCFLLPAPYSLLVTRHYPL